MKQKSTNQLYNEWRDQSGLKDIQLCDLTGANIRTLRRYRCGITTVPLHFLLACAALDTNQAIREFLMERRKMAAEEKRRKLTTNTVYS